MTPNFYYVNPNVDASKVAYDLAMAYANIKLSRQLEDNSEIFDASPAPREIEEMEFLFKAFTSAYEYFISVEPGEIEQRIKELRG